VPGVFAIVGPTAVGKSRLALGLAEALGGEIVNADALQVYRGFDRGTAKPTPEERRRVPHHLVDVLEPHELFSAGEFARRARRVIAEVGARGRPALVVGGSGFYQRALFEGISPLPAVPPEVRTALRERLARVGLPALREELERLDPATADRLAAGDTQRTLRALEVALASGRPLSEWQAARPAGGRVTPRLKIGLTLPRAVLYDRVSARIGRMLQAGWVGEVERLLARGLSPSLPAFQAIGYRQLVRYLRGEWSLDEATRAISRATCRYAKRQLTWFRADGEVRWLPAGEPDQALRRALELVGRTEARSAHG